MRVDGADVVDFASNDYLGFASDKRISSAAARAITDHAFGGGAARLISGNHPLHAELERAIAKFKRRESALLFSSGYLANVGCIPALAGKEDVIFADELNHASLVDGCRLARAEVKIFRHCDLDQLQSLLAASAGSRRRLIVTDAVFSMDGDIFPLDELANIAKRHDAWTYVDDAHGTGVLGETGRGSAELFGVESEIDVLMGTLGKALGTSGAFVCGSKPLTEFLLNRARTFVFTTATPPSVSAAALEAVRIAESDSSPRERLWQNCDYLKKKIRGSALRGLVKLADSAGYIIPVTIGDSRATMKIGATLFERGHLVGAIRPPTVPIGKARLRITLGADHTRDEIDRLVSDLSAELTTSS